MMRPPVIEKEEDDDSDFGDDDEFTDFRSAPPAPAAVVSGDEEDENDIRKDSDQGGNNSVDMEEDDDDDRELPSLEDRKCFLTCLASILVSSYKYDVIEQEELPSDVDDENNNNDMSGSGKSTNDDKSGKDKSYLSSDEEIDIPTGNPEADGVSMFLEDEEGDDEDMDDSSSRREDNNNNASKTQPVGRWRRFRRNKTNNNKKDDNDDNKSTHSMNSSMRSRQRRKRVSKAQQKLLLAATRHYRRRYTLANQFFRSSCDFLLMEQDISEPFYEELLPRLQTLKSPRIVPAGTNGGTMTPPRNILGKRWGSGGGGSSGSSSGSGSDDNSEEEGSDNKSDDGDDQEHNNDNSQGSNDQDKPTASEQEENQRDKQLQQQYLKQYEWMTEYDTDLAYHLPKLTAGAGYRCLCWLLFQHLLHANKRGYDARTRYAFKSIAVAVLIQDIERTLAYEGEDYSDWKVKNYTTWVSFATRKFEQAEAAMANRLIKLAQQSSKQPFDSTATGEEPGAGVSLEDLEDEEQDVQVVSVKKNKKKLVGARKHIVRGLKIGGVGVVAGTLLAVTGGMAAPAIAGALTFLGMGAVAGTFMSLASTTAVVHIFGVAGGSLAAYKMRRRTAGLTEFKIVQSASTASRQEDVSESSNSDLLPQEQEQAKAQQPRLARWREKAMTFKNRHSNPQQNDQDGAQDIPTKAELSRTICISGWLTDKNDFQRPWGITPTKPPPTKLEKLQRFYRVYNPDLIPVCDNLLKRWKKEESTFWELLEDKYGCNPDTLFPLRFGPMYDAALTEMELMVLDKLIVEIGEARGKETEDNAQFPESNVGHNHKDLQNGFALDSINEVGSLVTDGDSVVTVETEGKEEEQRPPHFQRQCYASVFEQVAPSSKLEKLIPPAHLATVWDFSSRYGGEVYSLHWETHMLLKLSQCFRDVALSATASAGQQALKLMVANTLALAASVPIYVMQALNSIDETWSVVVSRAEEAGQELARSLLINNAGHRPVTLMGYSFGARVIFECLKQLLVYQQQWEEYHEQKNSRAIGFAQHDEEGKRPNRKEKKWMLAELEFEREPASVVEDVILMGAPMYLSLSSWRACRQIVAGRFVNVYSRTDKILSLMFKYKQLMESFKPVCGNCTVAVPGVENIDISDLVSNHQEYVLNLGDILKRVRHGQPIRSSSNALDEVALIAQAESLAKQQRSEDGGNEQDVTEVAPDARPGKEESG